MATGPGFVGPKNAYPLTWESSGRLASMFVRNPATYPLARYMKMIQAENDHGLYLEITTQAAGRVINTKDHIWPFGADRPQHNDGLEKFQYKNFATTRYNYGYHLPTQAISQAPWNVKEAHSTITMNRLKTARAMRMISAITTTGNWTHADAVGFPTSSGTHTDTASNICGGYLDNATSSNLNIKETFDKIARVINIDTLGAVSPNDFLLVMNPNTAGLLSRTEEVHDFVKGSYKDARELLEKDWYNNNRKSWNLPPQLYGYDVVVDDTVKTTSEVNAGTLAKSYVFPDQTIAVLSRPSGLEDNYVKDMTIASTAIMFWYEHDTTIREFENVRDDRFEYDITECTGEYINPLSGFLITSATSAAS